MGRDATITPKNKMSGAQEGSRTPKGPASKAGSCANLH